MKNFFKTLQFLVLISIFGVLIGCNDQGQKPINEDLGTIKTEILKINKAFDTQTNELIHLVEQNKDEQTIQARFEQLRLSYKKMEWAI